MKRTISRPPARRKPPARKSRKPPARRKPPRIRLPRHIENPESSSSSSDNDDTGDIENPEEDFFSPTIPIKEAQKKDQERKKNIRIQKTWYAIDINQRSTKERAKKKNELFRQGKH